MESKQEMWGQWIDLQKISGKTIKQFCHDEKINYHVFQYWSQKRRKNQCVFEETLQPSFIPVIVEQAPNCFSQEILLKHVSGFRVSVNNDTDFELLSKLLRTIGNGTLC